MPEQTTEELNLAGYLAADQAEAILYGLLTKLGEEMLYCVTWQDAVVSLETATRWWQRRRAEDEERQAQEAQQRAAIEDAELAELARLKAKYGAE